MSSDGVTHALIKMSACAANDSKIMIVFKGYSWSEYLRSSSGGVEDLERLRDGLEEQNSSVVPSKCLKRS